MLSKGKNFMPMWQKVGCQSKVQGLSMQRRTIDMQIVIHAGVAFTDEGQIIDLFKTNAGLLNEYNVTILGFPAYRRQFRIPLKALRPGSEAGNVREGFLNRLPKNTLIERAIVSTPQFLGELPTTVMDGQFYPLAGQRIAYLGEVFEGMQVELFIALRNPGSFIPRALMSLPAADRQRVLEETDLSCLSWLTLIDNIRDLAPDVNITLWSDEASPLIRGDVVRTMAGLPENVVLDQEYSLLSSLVSSVGKQEIRTLFETQPTLARSALRVELGRIFEEFAQPEAIEEELDLPGWSEEIVEAFTELYEQDLEMLQNLPEVRFLAP